MAPKLPRGGGGSPIFDSTGFGYYLMKLLVLLTAVCLSLTGSATNHDSLALAIETDASLSPRDKATKYRKLAEMFIQQDGDEFDRYFLKSIEYAKEAGDAKEEGYAYLSKANHCFFTGDYPCARYYYARVGSVSDTLGDKWFKVVEHNGTGLVYYTMGKLDSALAHYLSAQAIALKMKDTGSAISLLINRGGIYRTLGNADSANALYTQADRLAQAKGDRFRQAQALINLGNIANMERRYEEALAYARKGHRLASKAGEAYYLAEARKGYAMSLIWADSLVRARAMLGKSMAYYLQAGDTKGQSDATRSLAVWQAKNRRLDSAKASLTQAYALNSTADNRLQCLQARSKIHELNRGFERSLSLYKEYKSVHDSLVNVASLEKLHEIQEYYESERKKRQIAEQQEVIKTKELAITRRNALIGSLFALVLVLVVFGLVLLERRKNRLRAEQDAAVIAEREKSMESIIVAQEEERRRIGADLHDGVTQTLGAISLKIQQLANKAGSTPMKAAMLEVDQRLREGIDEVRHISHHMKPYALENLGLCKALEMLLHRSLNGTAISYEFEELNTRERYADKVEITMYRIAQELLHNVVKHSGASHAVLQLLHTSKYLMLVVEDNGRGMAQAEGLGEGHGLMNIKGRLNALKGNLDMEPSPQAGTNMVVRIPVEAL